jgi:hypothetical protein
MIEYGPFTVPGSGQDMGMKGFKIADAKAPCDECLITWMRAGLEYSDGREQSRMPTTECGFIIQCLAIQFKHRSRHARRSMVARNSLLLAMREQYWI